jgi:hypothetical protein
VEPVTALIGVVLLAVGAVGATVTQRRMDTEGRSTRAPLFLVPFGILMGAGAALIRGWDLTAAIVAGAIVVPFVGALGRYLEVRRHRRAPR